jgi:uncharacterized membrane protein HdeD (DUF308 family)
MLLQILQYIACILTALVGIYATISPKSTTSFTGLSPLGERGVTEIRVVFGVFFIVLGLFPIITGSPIAFQMLGSAYLLTGVARVIAIFMDKSSEQSNWISVAFEVIFGLILIF